MGERLLLPPGALRRIREVAQAAWPLEACGLLEGRRDRGRVQVYAAHVLANVDDDPRHRYTIDPESWLHLEHAARAARRTIVGVWHSHPHGDATPSASDRDEAWPGWSYLIAGVTNGALSELRCWRLDDPVHEESILVFPENPQ